MTLGRKIRTIINAQAEKKKFSIVFDHTQVPTITAFAAAQVPTLAQGVTRSQRIGTEIRLVSIDMNVWVVTNNAAVPITYRCLLYRPKDDFDAGVSPYGAVLTNSVDEQQFVTKYDRMGTIGTQDPDQSNVRGTAHFRYRRSWASMSGPKITYMPGPLNQNAIDGGWAFAINTKAGAGDLRLNGNITIFYTDM